MDKRTESILEAIIREHIKSAQPVGSSMIVDKYKLGVSSATVRNKMAQLEEDGYIIQPHTSAGRIPTAKAYAQWVSGLGVKKMQEKETLELLSFFTDFDEQGLKGIAKELARISGAAVFWAIHRRNFYHTGISNLLTQPEFVQNNLIYDISPVIDRMEDIIENKWSEFEFGVKVLIGDKNPFSQICSVLVLKYRLAGQVGLVGLLGPLRMNYEHNLSLMRLLEEKLKD